MGNELIEEFGELITVYRGSAAGAPTTDGSVNPGKTTTFQTIASVQPMSGQELISLPEGERSKVWMIAFSESQMNTAMTAPSIPADVVERSDGSQFKVTRVEPWVSSGDEIAPFWRIRMCLLNP